MLRIFKFFILIVINFSYISLSFADIVTIEKNNSITKVDMPKACNLKEAKNFCNRLADEYARAFERNLIIEYNSTIDFSKPELHMHRKHSYQDVKMSFLNNSPNVPIVTLYTVFNQNIREGEYHRVKVETMNFLISEKRRLHLTDLFDNASLASMIFARAIEYNITKDRGPLFDVIVAATEIEPQNYVVTEKGIRLYFEPNTITNSNKIEKIDISINNLLIAHPKEQWWPEFFREDNNASSTGNN